MKATPYTDSTSRDTSWSKEPELLVALVVPLSGAVAFGLISTTTGAGALALAAGAVLFSLLRK